MRRCLGFVITIVLVAALPRAAKAQVADPGAPPPAVAAEPAPAPPAPAKPTWKKHEFVLGALANRRWLFDIPFWGIGGTLGVSIRPSEGFAVDILGEHLRGQSDNGLNAYVTRLRVPLQGLILPWLRIGGSIGFAYLSIERATKRSDSIERLGLAFGAEATGDVVSGDDISLYVKLRGDVDFMWGNVVSPGATGSLGVRF